MGGILDDFHSKYVPIVTFNDKTEVLDHIISDGDQLPEERAKNAQWQMFSLKHMWKEWMESQLLLLIRKRISYMYN